MKNALLLLLICSILLGVSCSQNNRQDSENTKESDRPNVIIIYTDDHGFADLGIQGQEKDLKTPNLDKLAKEGVLLTSGYVTAPQCVPSRAGLLAGRYQERFGVDQNQSIPFPLDEKMIAQRMKDAGYVTGMAGKWHLTPSHVQKRWIVENLPEIADKERYVRQDIPFDKKIPYMATEKGFDFVYQGTMHDYWANYTLEGERIEKQMIRNDDYRLDIQTQATVSFIDINHENPFFFYLGYYAPHVPLEATEKYLSRFSEDMPERRRLCLAMLSAIDDGVGIIKETLRKHGIDENTIIFFAGDNGRVIHF
jgi:arylsulfatase A-like enzyme